MLEYKCKVDGEMVCNVEDGDPHFEREDGTPCGGKLELWGEWFASAAEIPSRKAINWDGLSHC